MYLPISRSSCLILRWEGAWWRVLCYKSRIDRILPVLRLAMVLILPAVYMIMVLAPPGRMNRACEALLGIVAAFFDVARGVVPHRPGGLGGGAPLGLIQKAASGGMCFACGWSLVSSVCVLRMLSLCCVRVRWLLRLGNYMVAYRNLTTLFTLQAWSPPPTPTVFLGWGFESWFFLSFCFPVWASLFATFSKRRLWHIKYA